MKLTNVLLMVFLFTEIMVGQEHGIRFQQGTFEFIKEMAADQDKPIFIDIYTTWCGPCKKMDKEVFAVEEVGQYFNRHFINYKVDAERGEGIGIARSYRVSAYPSMLFLDADGSVKHVMRGYRPFEPFLDEAKTVVDTTHIARLADQYMNDRAFRKLLDAERKQKLKFRQSLKKDVELDSLHQLYVAGNRSADFMADYILRRHLLAVSDEKIVDEYFKEIGDNKSEGLKHLAIQSMKLEYAYDPEFEEITKAANLATDSINRVLYLNHISNNLERAFKASWESAIANKDTSAIHSLVNKQKSYLNVMERSEIEIDETIINSKLNFYRSTGMSNPYHTLAQAEMEKWIKKRHEGDSSQVISAARKIADLLLGYEHLKVSNLQWKDLLLQAEDNLNAYQHPHTYAPVLLMYHHIGEHNDAMNTLREGMIMGKKQDLDTSTLFKLFTRIKKEKAE